MSCFAKQKDKKQQIHLSKPREIYARGTADICNAYERIKYKKQQQKTGFV